VRHNPAANPTDIIVDLHYPIEGELRDLGTVDFPLLRRTGKVPLFNGFMERQEKKEGLLPRIWMATWGIPSCNLDR
jgi:hypothetical protein